MAALNHALMIPGLIIIIVLLWAWVPLVCLGCCLRRAGRVRRSREELLESGHMPHPGFEAPSPYIDTPAPGRKKHRRKERYDERRDDHQQPDENIGRGAHYKHQQAEKGKNTRHEGRRGHRETKNKERAHGWSRGGSVETLPLKPEKLAARESGRQRRLMDESRGDIHHRTRCIRNHLSVSKYHP